MEQSAFSISAEDKAEIRQNLLEELQTKSKAELIEEYISLYYDNYVNACLGRDVLRTAAIHYLLITDKRFLNSNQPPLSDEINLQIQKWYELT